MEHGHHGDGKLSFFTSRTNIALIVFLAIGAFFLVAEHRAHLLTGTGILVLLLAACVGMHFFMHGGHGGHDDAEGSASDGRQNRPRQQ
jgi:hypothetical protein